MARKIQSEDIKENSLKFHTIDSTHVTDSITGENLRLKHDSTQTILDAIMSNIGLFWGYDDLTSLVNGTTNIFNLSYTPIGPIWVIHNGIVRRIGSDNDYTLSGKVLTMNYIPNTNTTSFFVIYRHNGA